MTDLLAEVDELLPPVKPPEPQARPVLTVVAPPTGPSPAQAQWERCRPWIETSLEGSLHTIQDLERALVEGRAKLWPGRNSAIVTELETYSVGRVLRAWVGGGDLAELKAMSAGIEAEARLLGCTMSLVSGRPGWTKELKALGYELDCVVLRKAL